MNLWDLFRRTRTTKQNPVAAAVYVGADASPLGLTFPKLDARRLVHDGFNVNVTVYAAVTQIAYADAGIPWVLYRRGATPTSKATRIMSMAAAARSIQSPSVRARKAVAQAEVVDHPLLRLLERPNPLQGGAELQTMRVAHLLLHGNAYTITAGPTNGAPVELWALRPDRMRVVPHPTEWIGGYVYEVGGAKQEFAAHRVLHRRLPSMDDDYYGASPLRAAMRNVLTNNEAVRWNYALLKNSTRPPGMFVSKAPSGLTDVQYNRLKAYVDEAYAGAENAGRPMLGEGDLDWKAIALTPAEMEWLAGLKDARRQIATAFGIAPELLGDAENKTYSNYGEARKALYQDLVLPQKDVDRDALNNWLTPQFDDRLYLDYDRDAIEALEEDRDRVWSRVEMSTSLTVNEKREMLGFGHLPTERGGDLVLVSGGSVPIQNVLGPKENGRA